MFAKTIIDSDAFLDMPLSTQALYFHLSMRADDEGFVNNPKKIQRMIGASDDDIKVLLAKNFIILFESGVIVIKHWKIHNYIRGDRINETNYQDEKALLQLKGNGTYTLCQTNVSQMSDKCQSSVSIGKDSIDKDNIDKNSINNTLSFSKNGKSDSDKKKTVFSAQIEEIIAYLNLKSGKRFTTRNVATNRKITDRLKEGFTVDEFKRVVDNKVAAWSSDPRMVNYIRPQTLFGTKFEAYLNDTVTAQITQQQKEAQINAKQRNTYDENEKFLNQLLGGE